MKYYLAPAALACAIFTQAMVARAAQAVAIIPAPAVCTPEDGAFELNANTSIVTQSDALGSATVISVKLIDLAPTVLRTRTGLPLPLAADGAVAGKNIIRLWYSPREAANLGDEGYTLHIGKDDIIIQAASAAGIYYGAQSLAQLAENAPASASKGRTVAAVSITDRPRLAWRGFMLDVSRHFYDAAEVKAVLDQMALLKLNVFHWHLTDDNGWRIEIKKYPKLTTVGAWHPITKPEQDSPHSANGRYGGFYTQDEIREVVAYAAARHIKVVPEIDMPGHMSAAATAYPELSPANGWTPMLARQEKGTGERCAALCVGRAKTVEFCKDVLSEVLELFPSKEIHIGGDEVFYEQWEPCADMQAYKRKLGVKDWADVQVAFGNEMAAFLEGHGRTAIFWNNIYRQGVDKHAINHFWRPPMHHARDFANAGYDVLISDSSCYYFDHSPPLEKAYSNDPLKIAGLTPDAQSRILGIEGCEWTEHIATVGQLQPHIYPRLVAYAETAWSPAARKDWPSFQERLPAFLHLLDRMGIGYQKLLAK